MVVTGATGYIASHIVKELLDQGFRVRATVRDPSNTKRLKVSVQGLSSPFLLYPNKCKGLDDDAFIPILLVIQYPPLSSKKMDCKCKTENSSSSCTHATLQYLTNLPGATERLTFHKADLLVQGAFDDVVNGATHVIHTASPVPLELADDPYKAVIEPAVEGTKNVFNSIMKSST